jgi:hypothetical protein
MAMWHGPDTVNVRPQRNFALKRAGFTFTEAGARKGDELPSDAELAQMTRSELDDIAYARDVNISDAANKPT